MRNWETDSFFDEHFQEALHNWQMANESGDYTCLDPDEMTDVAEYLYFKHDIQAADHVVSLAHKLFPDALGPLSLLIRNSILHNDWSEVRRLMDFVNESADIDHDREIMYLRCELLFHDRCFNDAHDLLKNYYPSETDVFEKQQYIREVIGLLIDYNQFKEALEWYHRMEALGPLYNEDKMMIADMFSCMGEYDRAVELLTGILNEDAFFRPAWILMAQVHFAAFNYDDCIEACEFALAIMENDPQTELILARSYLAKGGYDFDKGLNLAHKIMQKCPEDELAYISYALGLMQIYQRGDGIGDILKIRNILIDAERIAKNISSEQFSIYINLAWTFCEEIGARIEEQRARKDNLSRIEPKEIEHIVSLRTDCLNYLELASKYESEFEEYSVSVKEMHSYTQPNLKPDDYAYYLREWILFREY